MAYCRQSDSSSVATSLSIPAQIDKLVQYKHCTLPDVQWASASSPEEYVNGFFCDKGVSAYGLSVLAKRPAGSEMLRILNKGDHVLCWSVDRMFRNVGDFGTTIDMFRRRGIIAHFVCEGLDLGTASGQLRAAVMAVMAEHFSRMIAFRTKEANAIKAVRQGKAPAVSGKKIRAIRQDEALLDAKDAIAPKVVASYVRKKKAAPVEKIERVWGYVRCSSDGQVESGLGLDSQRQKVLAVCESMDSEYMGMLDDEAISSFKVSFFNRPSGQRILNEAKRGDCVVAYRFDRVFRSLSDMLATIAKLREMGVTLKLIEEGIQTNSRDSDWYLSLLGTFAELESKIKGQRVSESLQFRKREGLVYSSRLAFFKVARVGGQRRYVLNFGKAVRIRMSHILHREVGLTINESCHIVNGLITQKMRTKKPDTPYVNYIMKSATKSSKADINRVPIVTNNTCCRTYESWAQFVDAIGIPAANRIDKVAREELAADISEPLLAFLKRTGISMDRFRDKFLTASFRKSTTGSLPVKLGDGVVFLAGTEDI